MEPRTTQKPLSPLDEYIEVQPLLRQIRVMQRFLDEVVDAEPYRQFHPDLHQEFMRILNEEFAPHALVLALAVTELEDAYPEIDRSPDSPLPPAD
jgi:hypothetical protein